MRRTSRSRPAPEAAPGGRLASLDALRGFDMFWIAGGGLVVSALERWSDNPVFAWLRTQLTHVEWAGFRFYDLIFPLFIFMVGASITFSIPKSLAQFGTARTIVKILLRGVLLFAVGLFYSGGVSVEWPDIRLLGVLQRIALCFTVTALLVVALRTRWLVALWVLILSGYWLAFEFVPIRDIQLEPAALAVLAEKTGQTNVATLFEQATNRITGRVLPGYNVANHFDYQYLPGRLYDRYWDPEGLLSTIPAIASCLLGVFAGRWVQNLNYSPPVRSVGLIVLGSLAMSIGYLWGFEFPVVKKIWTSTFVLVAGGYSLLLLGVFHQIIDVWGRTRWCQPFIWIGANALTIYLAAQILGFRRIADRLVGLPARSWLGPMGDTVIALVAVLVLFWFARFLYQRKIFIRL